jgi:hypothetical protein
MDAGRELDGIVLNRGGEAHGRKIFGDACWSTGMFWRGSSFVAAGRFCGALTGKVVAALLMSITPSWRNRLRGCASRPMFPKVGRDGQPWARGRNPFGIEHRLHLSNSPFRAVYSS